MVRHIVFWSLKPEAEGKSSQENYEIIRTRLERLPEVIPQIKRLEVRQNLLPGERFDVILYSEFDSVEDLAVYQNHPAHKEVAAYVALVRSDRVAGDYVV